MIALPSYATAVALSLATVAAVPSPTPTGPGANVARNVGKNVAEAGLSASELIHRGTRLHDEGKYDEALALYERALALEPENPTAHYEMAATLGVKKDYARCVEVARSGLQHPGTVEAQLYAIEASCWDGAGKVDEALKAFAPGIAAHPSDVALRYNIAITLVEAKRNDEAADHLRHAIALRPTYASPYVLLGRIYGEQKRDVPALFVLLRSLMLDHDSPRAESAAQQARASLLAGVEAKPAAANQKLEININVPDDLQRRYGELADLGVVKGLAVTSMYLQENEGKPQVAREVAALVTFLQMALEEGKPEVAANVAPLVPWEETIAPLLALQEQGLGEPFAYVVEARAGVAGASDWLAAHADRVHALEAALAPASAKTDG
jgi:tetratricopeptide (TPR) repeat protein